MGTVLLRWIKSQLKGHEFINNLSEVSQCFTNGQVLCALIHRYRPDLVDLNTLKDCTADECNERAFTIFQNELNIPKVMTANESFNLELIESKIWLNYLEQICEVFRGEIPHVKHPKLDFSEELREKSSYNRGPVDFSHLLKRQVKKTTEIVVVGAGVKRATVDEDRSRRSRKNSENVPVAVPAEQQRRSRKRRTMDKGQNIVSGFWHEFLFYMEYFYFLFLKNKLGSSKLLVECFLLFLFDPFRT